jgi:hypothetical protein
MCFSQANLALKKSNLFKLKYTVRGLNVKKLLMTFEIIILLYNLENNTASCQRRKFELTNFMSWA